MKRRLGLSPCNSYYEYKLKKQYMKKGILVGIIMFLIVIGLWNTFYMEVQGEVYEGIFVNNSEFAGDFVQNTITYDIYREPVKVKGIYVPTYKLDKIDELIELANTTEVNSFVIDVKNDSGYLVFPTDNPVLVEMGGVSSSANSQSIPKVLDKLYANDIYPIARVVVFKDKVVGNTYPERMIQDHDGNIYHNSSGETWLNPYNKDNWDYILEVCKEVINLGFKEIQFDYIRFHESMNSTRVDLPDENKTEIITEFVDYMVTELSSYGVFVSADVFGAIITSNIDAQIVGQDYQQLITMLDSICPMVYPSHYGAGSFGQASPDLAPYEIILGAMNASNSVVDKLQEDEQKAIVRPWLQDFTASWVNPHQVYGKEQVRAQIEAVYDAGLEEWILWNAVANYTEDALLKNE
ncbi:MAG: hypothetical protein ATN36_02660 [Epulopiscium sp. Nele67-Bin005]|nr:MAG: hypothetical protein ATN36_02660 [Epulopiscium sp. Nele67-Bin005]